MSEREKQSVSQPASQRKTFFIFTGMKSVTGAHQVEVRSYIIVRVLVSDSFQKGNNSRAWIFDRKKP